MTTPRPAGPVPAPVPYQIELRPVAVGERVQADVLGSSRHPVLDEITLAVELAEPKTSGGIILPGAAPAAKPEVHRVGLVVFAGKGRAWRIGFADLVQAAVFAAGEAMAIKWTFLDKSDGSEESVVAPSVFLAMDMLIARSGLVVSAAEPASLADLEACRREFDARRRDSAAILPGPLPVGEVDDDPDGGVFSGAASTPFERMDPLERCRVIFAGVKALREAGFVDGDDPIAESLADLEAERANLTPEQAAEFDAFRKAGG